MSVISYIILGIIVVQFINRIKRGLQQQAPTPQPQRRSRAAQPQPQPQPAEARMSAEESYREDPEGRTIEYSDYAEDWITPVTPMLQDEIRSISESEHGIVHESVHETVRVRRAAAAPASALEASPLRLDKKALAQALLLNEVLGEPRAKRPWNPHRSK